MTLETPATIRARTEAKRLTITHFTTELVTAVILGKQRLTTKEREFLLTDTPTFEECSKEVAADLPNMLDHELMRVAYNVWADYANGQL